MKLNKLKRFLSHALGGLVQYKNSMVAIAGFLSSLRHVEILTEGEWTYTDDVPGVYPDEWLWSLFGFSTLNINNEIYVFGGASDNWIMSGKRFHEKFELRKIWFDNNNFFSIFVFKLNFGEKNCIPSFLNS